MISRLSSALADGCMLPDQLLRVLQDDVGELLYGQGLLDLFSRVEALDPVILGL